MKKKTIFTILTILILSTSVNQAKAGWLFGKHQYLEGAWSDGNCAYIRHYYTKRFFGFDVGEGGFYDELVGCVE